MTNEKRWLAGEVIEVGIYGFQVAAGFPAFNVDLVCIYTIYWRTSPSINPTQ